MSGAPHDEPACAVRALAGPDGRVRVHARNHALEVEGQTSFAPAAASPSALDLLLTALAADVVAGLVREAARAGVPLEAAELSLVGRLENPLVALGVVGERGSPRLAEARGTLYVTGDAGEPALRALWERALAHAPVHATLARAAAIDITLKSVL